MTGSERFTPENISKVSFNQFRKAGLSRAKIEYIRKLASAVGKGELDPASFMDLEDEEIISKLITFPGIGRWTAEMFLIFALGRPDVLSVKDAGLKRGLRMLYELPESPSEELMLSIAESWRPYRSVASWYLWKVVD